MLSCAELRVARPEPSQAPPKRKRHRISKGTPIWFGRFKGTPIKAVPLWYLASLVQNLDPPRTKRVEKLCVFLKRYVESRFNGQATS